MKTGLVSRVVAVMSLGLLAMGCRPSSSGTDDRAGLRMVDDVPQLFFLPCDGEAVESVEVWLNADGDRVVIERDDDEMIWSMEAPTFDADGSFADEIDLPDSWWLEDTQIQIETSAGKAVVIVTGIEALEPEQLWSNSLLVPFEEFESRAAASC